MDLKKLGILFLLFVPLAVAQTTGPQPEAPVIPAEVHAKVRDLQLEQAKVTIQLWKIQVEVNQLQAQSNNLTAQINDALAKAATDAKVDPAKWKANQDTLKYDALPQPKSDEKKEPPKKP